MAYEISFYLTLLVSAALAVAGVVGFIYFAKGKVPGGGHTQQVHRSAFAEVPKKRKWYAELWANYALPLVAIVSFSVFVETVRKSDPSGVAETGYGWLYVFFGLLLSLGVYKLIIQRK